MFPKYSSIEQFKPKQLSKKGTILEKRIERRTMNQMKNFQIRIFNSKSDLLKLMIFSHTGVFKIQILFPSTEEEFEILYNF